MQHNEQSKLVLGGGEGGGGDKTKVRYANFDEEMIGMTTTVTNEDAGGAFGSQVGTEIMVARWQNLIPSSPWIAPSTLAQSKERKGSHFAAQRSGAVV